MCWGCFATPLIGSMLGTSFKIDSNRPTSVKAVSFIVPPTLTVLTMQIIKSSYNISFCGVNGFSMIRAVAILAFSASIGIIYSIGVNYLINKYIPFQAKDNADCCCKNKAGPIQKQN